MGDFAESFAAIAFKVYSISNTSWTKSGKNDYRQALVDTRELSKVDS